MTGSRPADEAWGPDDRTRVWNPRGVAQSRVMSGPDGVSGGFSTGGRPLGPDALADLIACLVAAQDDQRHRFGVGDPKPEEST